MPYSPTVVEQRPDGCPVGLAGTARGDGVHLPDRSGQGVVGQYAAQPLAQPAHREWPAGSPRSPSRTTSDGDDLAPLGVGDADGDRLGDPVEAGHGLLDEARGDLEAAGVDEVVDAAVARAGARRRRRGRRRRCGRRPGSREGGGRCRPGVAEVAGATVAPPRWMRPSCVEVHVGAVERRARRRRSRPRSRSCRRSSRRVTPASAARASRSGWVAAPPTSTAANRASRSVASRRRRAGG